MILPSDYAGVMAALVIWSTKFCNFCTLAQLRNLEIYVPD